MSFDYFYGQQSDLFTFYRVPKVLFTNERFWNISADAKMLYGILLDRMSLSAKNGWIDKNGRVYIIFTIDEAKMALNCAEQKAIKLLSELEKKAGLIERKRQGLGKPKDAWGSVSTNRTLLPSIANPTPKFSQVVVFPVPPFWLTTAMTVAFFDNLHHLAFFF